MGAVQKVSIQLTREDGTNETIHSKTLKELKIVRKLNDHARVFFSGGHIEFHEKEEFLLKTTLNTQITVNYIHSFTNETPIFIGVVTHIELIFDPGNMNYYMRVTGASYTHLMDEDRLQRSFQNSKMTYKDVYDELSKGYSLAVIASGIELDDFREIGKFILQYQESDWKFLKRIASNFHAGLVPDPIANKPSLTVGLPQGESYKITSSQFLNVKKRLAKYQDAEANFEPKSIPEEYIYYRLRTSQLYVIGDIIEIPNRQPEKFYVYLSTAFIQQDELYFETVITPYGGMRQAPRYNKLIAGITLEGSVIDVGGPENDRLHDKVKLKFNFDDPLPPDKATWFSYTTFYSAEGHTGFYCMPELGEFVKIYFPSSKEEEAVAVSSRRDYIMSEQITELNTKCLRTKDQKDFTVTPSEVRLQGKDNTLKIQFNQDVGVTVSSPNEIKIESDSDVLLQSKRILQITADKAIVVKCGSQSGVILNKEMVTGDGVTYVFGGKVEKEEETASKQSKQDKPQELNESAFPAQTKDWIEIAKQIIVENESRGGYGALNPQDGQGTESCPYSLSVGKIQWYAERAHDLMRKIKEKNPEKAKEILGKFKIYNELSQDRSVFHNRTVKDLNEIKAISKFLSTPEGKAVQDQTISDDVPGYIQHGRRLGLTDKKVLTYFADLENQGGAGGSRRVVRAAGGANGITLDKIHQAALKDSRLGTAMGHGGRRKTTYQKCNERLNF